MNLFAEKRIQDIRSSLQAISSDVKQKTTHVAELRSYGHVLMATKEFDKAEVVFMLNKLLYPDNPGVFENLGDYYIKTGNKDLARENFQKLLQLQPENEAAKKFLANQ